MCEVSPQWISWGIAAALQLTWYVSVTALQGVEVVHEFFHRDLEGLKQASVFEEAV